jgi:hypothetical protein
MSGDRDADFARMLDRAERAGRLDQDACTRLAEFWAEKPAARDSLTQIVRDLAERNDPAKAVGLDEISYDDVLADKRTLDYVARAICLERDCDYLTALEDLQGWREQCEGTDVTLRAVIEDTSSPLELRQLCNVVMELELSETSREQAIVLSADVPSSPSGETNEHGQVKLASDVDRARLLTDPYEIEAAFLAARELSPTLYADRETFELEYRSYVEAGLDLVATIQLQRHRAELGRQQVRSTTAQQRYEQSERARRAQRREAAEAVQKNLDKLEDL